MKMAQTFKEMIENSARIRLTLSKLRDDMCGGTVSPVQAARRLEQVIDDLDFNIAFAVGAHGEELRQLKKEE